MPEFESNYHDLHFFLIVYYFSLILYFRRLYEYIEQMSKIEHLLHLPVKREWF